jgi:C4-type Zn-finger protein
VPPFSSEVNSGTIRRVKDCPLCGETMRLTVRELRDKIPGTGESAARVAREWICPECDYFEEAEAGEE